jgi:hypothetical protein
MTLIPSQSAHVGMVASNTYLLLTEVLPLAIRKFGGVDADALRKAALSIDLPEGSTMLGFGIKFSGEGVSAPGQNDRAFPVIIQYVDDARRACRFASRRCPCRRRPLTRSSDRRRARSRARTSLKMIRVQGA